jgi:hypothetical protein
MSIRFDAAADRLTYTGSIPVPTSGLTVTCWINIRVNRADYSDPFRIYNSSISTVVTCGTDSNGTTGMNYYTGGGSPLNGVSLTVGTWYPIAISHDTGTTGRVFVRVGGTTNVASGTVSSSTPAGLCIAGRDSGDASEWFNGEIAQVRVWGAELTQAQVEAEWASATPVITTNLFANWPLANATDLTDTVASRVLTTPNGTGQTNGADDPPNGGATNYNGTATSTVTASGSAAGTLGKVTGSAQVVTAGGSAAGAKGGATGASSSVTASGAGAGAVGKLSGAASAVTISDAAAGTVSGAGATAGSVVTAGGTASGTVGKLSGSAQVVTTGASAAGAAGGAAGTSQAVTAGATSAGSVGTSSGSASQVTVADSATGTVTAGGGGSAGSIITAGATAAGIVGSITSAASVVTAVSTAAGVVGKASGATSTVTAAGAASGTSGVIYSGTAASTVTASATATGTVTIGVPQPGYLRLARSRASGPRASRPARATIRARRTAGGPL